MVDNAKVTVLIPVGPYAVYKKWLKECFDSVFVQTLQPDELLIIDDMADCGSLVDSWVTEKQPAFAVKGWNAPWRLGDLTAWNCGVGLARNDLVFLLSCDDTIRPECLDLCVREWEAHDCKDAFYYVGAHYMGGEWPDQTVPFGNAMVTKGLWRLTGGLPIEAASGASDAAHISIMMVHFPDRLIPVANGQPLYDYRTHNQTVTAQLGPWSGVVEQTRGLVTNRWQPLDWGRMS